MARLVPLASGFRNRISTKLMLVVGILIVPVIVLSYLLYSSANEQVVFARDEAVGAEYLAVTQIGRAHV